jgi:hypothetical protein
MLLILLILAQVLICNHIILFQVAVAFIFIYVIIRLPMDLKTDWLLTWAFLGGVVVDLFSDTPGVNAMSSIILAMVKRPCLYAYIPRDDRTKNIVPSLSTLGFAVYGKYLLTMTTIYSLLAFSLEFLNFADIQDILIMTVSSSLLSFVIILGLDSLMISNKHIS